MVAWWFFGDIITLVTIIILVIIIAPNLALSSIGTDSAIVDWLLSVTAGSEFKIDWMLSEWSGRGEKVLGSGKPEFPRFDEIYVSGEDAEEEMPGDCPSIIWSCLLACVILLLCVDWVLEYDTGPVFKWILVFRDFPRIERYGETGFSDLESGSIDNDPSWNLGRIETNV